MLHSISVITQDVKKSESIAMFKIKFTIEAQIHKQNNAFINAANKATLNALPIVLS